jgi:hypothetical protein
VVAGARRLVRTVATFPIRQICETPPNADLTPDVREACLNEAAGAADAFACTVSAVVVLRRGKVGS